jgi:hypothetical protein
MARSTLTYFAVGAALALTACGGGSSNSTGPTAAVPQAADTEVAAPSAPTPKPASSSRQFSMAANVTGSYPPGIGGCLSIQTDSPPGETPCVSQARTTGDEGTRGTVTARPDSGYRFTGWSRLSSDCGGENVNPCSFAFDRNKVMTALFERTTASASASTPSAPAPHSALASPPAPQPQFTVVAVARVDAAAISRRVARGVPYSSSANLETGCVIIDGSACGYPPVGSGYERGGVSYSPVSNTEAAGTRGTVTAVPDPGHRFLGWTSSSADCAGSTTNPCHFTYDRNKTITAIFD